MDTTDTRAITTEGYVFRIIQGQDAGLYLKFGETISHCGTRMYCSPVPLADAQVFPGDVLGKPYDLFHGYYVAPVRCVRTTTAVTTLHPDDAKLSNAALVS